MTPQEQDYLDKLFVHDVNMIPKYGVKNSHYDRLLLSGILRRLTLDEQSLAPLVAQNYETPLMVLVPEPESGNTPRDQLPFVPSNIQLYAPELTDQYPPGFYLKPYTLEEYLSRTEVVLYSRSITPREIVKFLSNKLGGVHIEKILRDIAEGGRGIDAETLYWINRSFTILGENVLYQQFQIVADRIWRCTAPLKEEIVDAYGGNCSLD